MRYRRRVRNNSDRMLGRGLSRKRRGLGIGIDDDDDDDVMKFQGL